MNGKVELKNQNHVLDVKEGKIGRIKMFQVNRLAKQVLIRKENVNEYPCMYCGATVIPYATECMGCGANIKWKEFSDYVKEMAEKPKQQADNLKHNISYERNEKTYFCKDCGKQITANAGIYGNGYCVKCGYKHRKKRTTIKKKVKRFRHITNTWEDIEKLPDSAKKEYNEHRECKICGKPITDRSKGYCMKHATRKQRKQKIVNIQMNKIKEIKIPEKQNVESIHFKKLKIENELLWNEILRLRK